MGVRVHTNGYNPKAGERHRGVALDDNLILAHAGSKPMVFCKWLTVANEFVVGFASCHKFNGNVYLRKHFVPVKAGHEYASLHLYDELTDGTRIRRVETTECEPWYSPTKRLDYDKPIFFYYELSKEDDRCFRMYRWAKPRDAVKKATANIVSISQLKQKRAL